MSSPSRSDADVLIDIATDLFMWSAVLSGSLDAACLKVESALQVITGCSLLEAQRATCRVVKALG